MNLESLTDKILNLRFVAFIKLECDRRHAFRLKLGVGQIWAGEGHALGAMGVSRQLLGPGEIIVQVFKEKRKRKQQSTLFEIETSRKPTPCRSDGFKEPQPNSAHTQEGKHSADIPEAFTPTFRRPQWLQIKS